MRNVVYADAKAWGYDLDSMVMARGLVSDALVVFALAWLMLLTKRLWLRFGIGAAWCLLLAGNYEFIFEKGANLDFSMTSQALSPVFISGSVWSKPLLEKFCDMAAIYVLAWVAAHALLSTWPVRFRHWFAQEAWFAEYPHYQHMLRRSYVRVPRRGTSIALIVLSLAALLCPGQPPTVPNWQVYNPVHEWVLVQLSHLNKIPTGFNLDQASRVTMFYKRDLNAPPRVAPVDASARPNVLVIVVESLSHEQLKRGWLPELEKLSAHSLYYPNVLTATAVTVNGLYALFCGDYPRFSSSSWNLNAQTSKIVIDHGLWSNRPCMPEILARQGYTTRFMEAAPLEYANKKSQLPRMGFRSSKGGKDLVADTYGWGLSDAQLMEKIHSEIAILQGEKKPWMLAALTAGTHHPYDNVPGDFMPEAKPRERAFRYADAQVSGLIRSLDEATRKNTIIIVTSDEATETNAESPVSDAIAYNRGFMMIMPPSGEAAYVTDNYSQIDLQLSVLDYLMIEDSGSYGRSLLREYESFRPTLFGNAAAQRINWVDTPTSALICNIINWSCSTYALSGGTVFEKHRIDKEEITAPEKAQILKDFLRFNEERTLPAN